MSLSSHQILGHKSQIQALERDLETGNVSHAYLFEGPAHLGKFTVAKAFAEELIATDVAAADEELLRTEVKKLFHPDVLVIDMLWREEISEDLQVLAGFTNISQAHRLKAKAKSDSISIDDVRALQERLNDVPRVKYRAALIRNVERLQAEGVNALLKVLEEPPEGLVFILTTSAPESVLPTLKSRTRRLSFQALPRATLRPLTKGLDEEEAQFLLHLSQGAPGIIEKLKNDPEKLREERKLSTAAASFWRESSSMNRMQLLTPLHERDDAADRFLLHLSLTYRQLPPGSEASLKAGTVFRRFLRGIETNVSRQLLCAEFAMNL